MVTGIKLKMGKVNVRTTGFPSEANFVKQVNQGMRALEKNLLWVIEQFEDVTPDIMKDALQPIFDKSQEYVPKRTRALMNSGYVEVVERRGRPYVELGYAAGGKPDYAAYVHENTEMPHAAPTRAKFLEAAINEEIGTTIDRLEAGYRNFMGA